MPRQPYELFDTPEQKALLESRNVLLQFDEIKKMVAESSSGFSLTVDTIKRLHYLAIHDIFVCAGNLRQQEVRISNTPHQPPPFVEVPGLTEEMCAYVNGNFGKSATHLAAYLMWRHNWIHPFNGGNGRTSRALSYLVLCARLGYYLPGSPTVPQQIADSAANRQRYQDALRRADIAHDNGLLDTSEMESLISDCLGAQLYTVYQAAAETS